MDRYERLLADLFAPDEAEQPSEWICYQMTYCPTCGKGYGLTTEVRHWGRLIEKLGAGTVACERCGSPLIPDTSN